MTAKFVLTIACIVTVSAILTAICTAQPQTNKLPPPVPPANTNGVKVDFVSRSLRFGIVAIEGHHYAFGLGLVHAESCPCKVAPPPRDDQTLPDGAFIPLGGVKPAEDEEKK